MDNRFLTNYTEMTFLDELKANLSCCKAFYFSVSFIKKAGLILLIKDIEAALQRGCRGRIITSTYQNFTDIESLKIFLNLQSRYPLFECHLDYECFRDEASMILGYHSKGYLFEFSKYRELVVGSSNITRYALLKNIEWDVALKETYDEGVYDQAKVEFDEKWNTTLALDQELIDKYTQRLNYAIECWDMDGANYLAKIKPNYMQRKALKELNRFRSMGVNRALAIASAGSGKTFLAAFDALNYNPKRLLFIAHEATILNKALESFQAVFGSDVSYGLFAGSSKEWDADFVFATNLSMANSLNLFLKDEFDYIVIDECHHSTAETYRRIIDYFEPGFLLGLTATPERMDNQDVFELFDHNVPYELRLADAIANDLVVPFKYYGIRDKLVDYGLTNAQERKMIAQLATDLHCDFIASQIEKYRPQGKLKALAFCRNITHARMMAENMADKYRTAYLTGKNNIAERLRTYKDLQEDNSGIEILFTVDILNEGVDIPGVNMVLFLRPTDSSTVFIQQLGRGLRKYLDKPYVTVLDFIGNSYKRSVQIALALGSLGKNFVMEKKLIASLVRDNFRAIGLAQYGVEINIDDLSKEEILSFIDEENFNSLKYLKQDYFNFKKYIGAEYYPNHLDYLNNDCAPDLLRFMNVRYNGSKNYSYYNFLKSIDEENLPVFSKEQVDYLNYLSNMLPIVRVHEYEITRCLLKNSYNFEELLEELGNKTTEAELEHALSFMRHIQYSDYRYHLDVELDDQMLEYLDDLLTYGLRRYEIEYGDTVGFKLWQNYRMDQVQLKLLKNPGSNQVGTYYYDDYVVIFASLKKNLAEEDKLNYKDKFLKADLFQWESKNNLSNKELNKLMDSSYVHLFIRKVNEENGVVLPFIYVGKGHLTNMRNSGANGTYLFDVQMENTLPEYLQYDFGLNYGS